MTVDPDPPAGEPRREISELTNLPDRVPEPPPLQRHLSNRDFELVIRRAAELQAREAERGDGEEITEAEALRIGRELGLSTQHLHRALAEVDAGGETESGPLVRLFGNRTVHASRAIRGEAEPIARELERYLVEREYLAVLRRFPDRFLLTRASGVMAAMGRASSQIFSRSPLLRIDNLEVSVRSLGDGYVQVSLSTSLGGQRTAAAASSIVGGGTGSAIVGAALGIAIAPPAAILALPIFAVTVYGARVYYERLALNVEVQLESLLDRLEHGELPAPARSWSYPRR